MLSVLVSSVASKHKTAELIRDDTKNDSLLLKSASTLYDHQSHSASISSKSLLPLFLELRILLVRFNCFPCWIEDTSGLSFHWILYNR
jgi:hypothetical protein